MIDHKAPVIERYPSIAKWIHPTLNGVKPEELYALPSASIWWMCDIDESHVWSSSLLIMRPFGGRLLVAHSLWDLGSMNK